MVKAVVFDADDTLLDLRPAVTAGLDAVSAELASCGVELSRATLEADWDECFTTQRVTHVQQIRVNALALSLGRVGQRHRLEELAELYFAVRFARTRPYPGIVEMLAWLRRDHILGYATNGNSEAARCGLPGEFAFELYAQIDGLPKKPARGFFDVVVAMAGCAPEEIVYVGDSYEPDVVGPVRSGLRAIWWNRAADVVPEFEERPDAVVATIGELLQAIASLPK